MSDAKDDGDGAMRTSEGNNNAYAVLDDVIPPSSLRDQRRAVTDSFAMVASNNIRTCYYRSGYDISVPLPPRNTFPELAPIPPDQRRFFISFKDSRMTYTGMHRQFVAVFRGIKGCMGVSMMREIARRFPVECWGFQGSLYLGSSGSEARMSVLPLDNEADGVVVTVHCHGLHHGHHASRSNVPPCQSAGERFDEYEYQELMNTTFGLVVAGRSLGTPRLGEVLSAGAIPVFVAKNLVRPFREELDWPSFSFVFSPEIVERELVKRLRSVPPEKLVEMQRKSLEVYEELFGDRTGFESLSRRVLEVLVNRVMSHRRRGRD